MPRSGKRKPSLVEVIIIIIIIVIFLSIVGGKGSRVRNATPERRPAPSGVDMSRSGNPYFWRP
jgi:hypothetical protein